MPSEMGILISHWPIMRSLCLWSDPSIVRFYPDVQIVHLRTWHAIVVVKDRRRVYPLLRGQL